MRLLIVGGFIGVFASSTISIAPERKFLIFSLASIKNMTSKIVNDFFYIHAEFI